MTPKRKADFANVHSEDRSLCVDLGLAVMCALQRPGERLTYGAIAHVTGLSHEGPRAIEQRALMKLRRRLGMTSALSTRQRTE